MKKVEHAVEYKPLDKLRHLKRNPRKISKENMEKLVKSIKANPDYFEARPIICSDRTGKPVIIAGNQRLRAAKTAGLSEVPVVVLHGLSEEREREITIRDNVELGEWDFDMLESDWNAEDLNEWGVDEFKPHKEIIEDEPDPIDEENAYSVVGDIYRLGDHLVFCGSFEDDEKVRKLFGDKQAACTFTDPPYNVAYKSADGKSIKNDKMAREDFLDFLSRAFNVVAENTAAGGGVISWMSDRELFTLWDAFNANGLKFRQLIVWVKDRFTLGHTDFQYAAEPAIYGVAEGSYDKDNPTDDGEGQVALYARGNGKFQNNRKLSNTWFFAKPNASKEHPTMKPVGLCAKGVLAMSEVGDIVFDPFLGSGSTLIACEQTGRRCFGCELDPKYCDVIRKRWYKFTHGDEDGWQEGTPAI